MARLGAMSPTSFTVPVPGGRMGIRYQNDGYVYMLQNRSETGRRYYKCVNNRPPLNCPARLKRDPDGIPTLSEAHTCRVQPRGQARGARVHAQQQRAAPAPRRKANRGGQQPQPRRQQANIGGQQPAPPQEEIRDGQQPALNVQPGPLPEHADEDDEEDRYDEARLTKLKCQHLTQTMDINAELVPLQIRKLELEIEVLQNQLNPPAAAQ